MAESITPRAKKAKRSAPLTRVTAEERARQFKDDLYADGGVLFCRFWEGMGDRFPNLAAVASHAIWMPVASVNVERSFSQYKHLLNDRRESLTEENTKRLVMLYYNGDIEGHF